MSENWKKIQQKTFTNWFNDRLKGNLKVARRQAEDVQKDLQDGTLLVELLNILANPRKIPRYNKSPRNKVQCMENLSAALAFIKTEGLKIVNIGPEDIYDGNLKLILGLIWTLIRHYQIKSSGRGLSTKQALLLWVNQQIPEYHVKNFTIDWNDGRALCALSNSIKPGLCMEHWTLDRSCGLANCELGLQLAFDAFGIPMVLSAEDLHSSDVDELSVMTYISYFIDPANNKLLEWIRSKIPYRNIQNLCTDWNDGSNLGALMDACFPDTCPEWVDMVPEQAVENLTSLMGKVEATLSIVSPMKPKEMADPKVDEILVATYLAQFRNAQLKLCPEGFSVFPPQLGSSGVAIVHKPVNFVIDTKGKPPPDGSFEVVARGPRTEVVATLTAANYGDYDVSFIPNEPGEFEVSAQLQGDEISGSPFTIQVIDPSMCHIVDDIPEQLQVGIAVELTIEAGEAGKGALDAQVEVEEDQGDLIRSQVTDMGDGNWKLLLDPVYIGEGTIHVTWSGSDIPMTPFDVAVFDASKVKAAGLPEEGKVGELIQFYISAHGAGLCLPKVIVNGPTSQCRCSTKERPNGRWDMSFTPWEIGSHKITILWGGHDISNSPITLNVAASSDASGCTASGHGLDKCIATIPAEFVLTAPDDPAVAEALSVKVIGSEVDGEVEMKNHGNGKFDIIYTCTVEGMYKIEIRFRDKNIPGSPYEIQCLPAPDASKCRAYGQCLNPAANLFARATIELFVDTSKAGTGELAVVAKGKGGITPKIYMSDDGSGTYSVKFTPPQSGKCYVHVWWFGVHIPKSPFQLRIHDGPDASKVIVKGPGVGKEVDVGQPARFTIETKDAGLGTLLIRVHGIKDAFDIEAQPISEDDPRTLEAYYNPVEAGDYRVVVQWSGIDVPNSPFRVNVRDREREERHEQRAAKKKELNTQYSSETHSKTKSASLPGRYVYPAAQPTMTMIPESMMHSTPIAEQTTQRAVSFKEQKKK